MSERRPPKELPPMKNSVQDTVVLRWARFAKMTEARAVFFSEPCVYVQAAPDGAPLRIGKASKGLDRRYHGGEGGSIDAAMHGSGNLVFVAPVEQALRKSVEDELLWRGRRVLTYNDTGTKNRRPDVLRFATKVMSLYSMGSTTESAGPPETRLERRIVR